MWLRWKACACAVHLRTKSLVLACAPRWLISSHQAVLPTCLLNKAGFFALAKGLPDVHAAVSCIIILLSSLTGRATTSTG